MSPPCGSNGYPPVIDAARTWILDTLGVGIAGSSATGMDALREASGLWGNGEAATIWGTTQRAPAPAAAFVNGTQVHNQEFDCLHEGAVVHAMATLLPAILAVADRDGGVSGRDLIAAVVAGIDIAANLGSRPAGFRFFRPATPGGFSAIAGMSGRSGAERREQIADAFMHYGQTSGTMQPHLEGNFVADADQVRARRRGAFGGPRHRRDIRTPRCV